jgi:metal-responsive CopG/Arc/MetJ family transcriptional regulator
VHYVSTMATIIPRFLVHLPKDVQEAVEDFRFSRRMESRSAAIRELIKLGLEVAKKQGPPKPKSKKG